MALFKNDPFPGVDYSKFLTWEKVVTPAGQVLYVVPGNPAYVYDPVTSNATGRKVFRANPKGQIEDAQKEKERQEKALDQQEFNQSPAGQLLPVAATTGGVILASQLGGGGAASTIPIIAGSGGAAGASTGVLAGTAAQGAASAAPALAAPAAVAPAAVAPTAAAPAAGLASGFGIGIAPLAAVAAGTYLGGKSAYDMLRGKEDKSIPGLIGRGTLGIATGGLSELARPFLQHESTRDVAKKHTAQLLSQGKDDQNWQQYAAGMREQFNSGPPDPSKPFAGKYATWADYEKGGLEAADLTGVYGNLKVYGPEWANLTQEQRQAITQANIESGLYKSKKGEVEITDEQKAIENKNNVLKGFQVGVQTAAPALVNKAPAPVTNINAVGQAAARGALGRR